MPIDYSRFYAKAIVDGPENIEALRQRLEVAINSTPTGPEREKLTEANIHLYQMEEANKKMLEAIREASKLQPK